MKTTLAIVALVLVAAPVALGDERITAVPVRRYLPTDVTIDQGERLSFRNQDFEAHDVASKAKDSAGKRLFATSVLDPNTEAFVEGSQYLTTGAYPFFCRIHPEMEGTLHVTGAGQPVPRPDTEAPSLSVKMLDSRIARVRKRHKLKLRVKVDEPATVSLTARASGRRLGSREVKVTAAGTVTVKLKLTRRGRRLVRDAKTLRVKISASAIDSAGNKASLKTKRKLR